MAVDRVGAPPPRPGQSRGCPRHAGAANDSAKMGISDPRKKYAIGILSRGDCLFAATGITDGRMLDGVKFGKDIVETETVVMRSITGTVRRIKGEHRRLTKF